MNLTDIHPCAIIDTSAKVWSFTVIGADVRIGRNSVIGSHFYVGKGTTIGEGVHIPTGVFPDDRSPRSGNTAYMAEPPLVRRGASIGAGAVILPGIEIGAAAMIGAGAVVTKDVMLGDTTWGVPARAKNQTMPQRA